ncbi:KGGVGR-motif variant AAA ATPase [Massilia sp. GER05]|uniref:KGGVGR-motif variant AAA ATPase n=1 Tax=Massilia sp. GER05 TaxID=3394605 RepID=UPI003F83DE15
MRDFNGKIFTFYSFKGGVGRTMSLANVAFLASMAGKRVLMMDWDLEAPGLEYYFRGVTERTVDGILKDAPGILNLLDEWDSGISSLETEDELEEFTSRHASADNFGRFVRSVIDERVFPELLPSGGCLDIISAGSKFIGEAGKPYEEVLSNFSWHNFFNNNLGGYLLDSLREWARKDYDIILIDSRTGLADVAGICTLAMPDVVVLCFVLNQQNIDGIGQVASAITSQTHERVKVRVVPMRVDRRDSAEGSDAQARAISVLSRVGGIPSHLVQEDLLTLHIAAEDNLPFYETLAPFFAVDLTLDPLTLSYVRLAKELIGPEVGIPEISLDTLKVIKNRIVPKNATIQYVIDLQSAEPLRAHSEINRLLNVAAETAGDGQIEVEYLAALCDTVLHVASISDGEASDLSMLNKTMDILRYLSSKDSHVWHGPYIDFIRSALEIVWIFDNEEEELKIRSELARLLENDESAGVKLLQVDNLQEIARIYRSRSNFSLLHPLIERIGGLIKDLATRRDFSEVHARALLIAVSKYSLFRGEVYLSVDQFNGAKQVFLEGLANIENIPGRNPGDEIDRLKFRLLVSLAKLPSLSIDESSKYCVQAAYVQTHEFQYSAADLFSIILRPAVNGTYVLEFARAVFSDVSKRRKLISYFTRREELLFPLVDLISRALRSLRKSESTDASIAHILSTLFELVSAINRSRTRLSPEIIDGITARVDKIITDTGLTDEKSRRLVGMLENIRILSKVRR